MSHRHNTKRHMWKKLRGKSRKQKAQALKALWVGIGSLVRFRSQRQSLGPSEWCYDPGIQCSDTAGFVVVNKRYKSLTNTEVTSLFDKLCMVVEFRKSDTADILEAKVLFEEKMFWVSTRDLRPCKSAMQRKVIKSKTSSGNLGRSGD